MGTPGTNSPYRVSVAFKIIWGEGAIELRARMTPGGEMAVKAADGVGLKSIIHRGRISITEICCRKLHRRFLPQPQFSCN
jgi:hypothetical protein